MDLTYTAGVINLLDNTRTCSGFHSVPDIFSNKLNNHTSLETGKWTSKLLLPYWYRYWKYSLTRVKVMVLIWWEFIFTHHPIILFFFCLFLKDHRKLNSHVMQLGVFSHVWISVARWRSSSRSWMQLSNAAMLLTICCYFWLKNTTRKAPICSLGQDLVSRTTLNLTEVILLII